MSNNKGNPAAPQPSGHAHYASTVASLLVMSTPWGQIVEQCAASFGGDIEVTEDVVRGWARDAIKGWAGAEMEDMPYRRAIVQAKIEYRQHLATLSNDAKAYNELLKLEMDLHGLRTQTRVHRTENETPIDALTPEQKEAEINKLLAKKAAAERDAAARRVADDAVKAMSGKAPPRRSN